MFDRKAAAAEASWAGAGMLAPAGEFESDSPLLRMSLRSLSAYPRWIADLERESGVAIDYRRCGGMEVALSAEEEAPLARSAELRRSLGIQSEICRHHGCPAYFYPEDAIVDPRALAQALLIACRGRGVSIREHEGVLEIAEDGRSVRTALGTYSGAGVLIAAGAWSSGLYPNLPQTRPVRGHLIGYAMAPETLAPIIRNKGTYVFQRSSGLTIAGSSTEDAGFDRAIDERVVADIARRAGSLVPQLRGLAPIERWNGLRPGIDAEGPLIGRLPGTAVFTAFGHYRNGILLAPETARLVAAEAESLRDQD